MSHHIQSTTKAASAAVPRQFKKKHAQLVENIYTCLNEHLLILMNQMLNTAGDTLFNLSEKASSNEKQMLYLDTIQLINANRSNISNQFFVSFNESLSNRNKPALGITNDGELSLVEQDEMDEMVAITTIHSQALNLFGEEINNLEARLEYLEINDVDIFEKDAVNPKKLCEVFKKTLEPLSITIDIKLILFRLYNEQINIKLGVLYKSLNELFINAGVLPEIVLRTSTVEEFLEDDDDSNTAKTVRHSDKNYAKNLNQAENSHSPSNQQSASSQQQEKTLSAASAHADLSNNASYTKANSVISQFLNGDMVKQGPGIPESFSRLASHTAADGKHYYKRNEVMKALSRLQYSLMQPAMNVSGEDAGKTINVQLIDSESIKRELLADIGSQNGGIVDKQVNVLDERSIDFVGMMFNAITHDESISKVISNLIMRLQIPVIKVAMLDQNLFTDEEHPAKSVLNLLSDAGKGVTSEKDRVYDEIESIVDNVIETFDIDIGIFEEAVEALQQLISNEKKLTDETERAEQCSIIQAHARDVVLDKLKIISSQKRLPNAVRPLVLKHWPTLMLNKYIKHGKNSEQWLQSVLLLRLLLNCMQPIKEKSQYMLLKNNHQTLIDSVNDELYETFQDKDEIDDQIQSLRHLFVRMIDDYGVDLIQQEEQKHQQKLASDNVLSFIDKSLETNNNKKNNLDTNFVAIDDNDSLDDEAQAVQVKLDSAKAKIAQLGNQARPGNWYEIYNGEDRAVRRLKLSVILTETAQLIFVDRRGVKVIEKDAIEFLEELNDKRSSLIADHSAFDHALGKVIHTLAA